MNTLGGQMTKLIVERSIGENSDINEHPVGNRSEYGGLSHNQSKHPVGMLNEQTVKNEQPGVKLNVDMSAGISNESMEHTVETEVCSESCTSRQLLDKQGGEYKFGKDHARKKMLREIFRKKQRNARKMPEPGFKDSDSVNSQGSQNNKNKKKRTIKDYLRMKVTEEKESDFDDNSDLEMSEIVTSEEGNRKLIVVGNDVIGLFPAMQEVRTGGTVVTQSMKNDMANKGLEYMEIARYCAINRHLCGDLSEVENVLPWRTKWGKGGKKPGMQNEEVKGKKKNLQNVWTFPPKAKPTDHQKKVLAARMGEIGVRVVWRNLMFQFGGHTYLQSEGGPIGARLTMACARLVMQDWAEDYKEILTRSGLDIDNMQGMWMTAARLRHALSRGQGLSQSSRGSCGGQTGSRRTWRRTWWMRCAWQRYANLQ